MLHEYDAIPILDMEDEECYNQDLQELYEQYQSESSDYFIIEQEY
jgi:hypothetical protein